MLECVLTYIQTQEFHQAHNKIWNVLLFLDSNQTQLRYMLNSEKMVHYLPENHLLRNCQILQLY